MVLLFQAPPTIDVNRASIQIYFSPGSDLTKAITDTIREAKTSILVQAYSFTSAPIAEALRAAHKRGIGVQVILDKSQPKQRYTVATFLKNAGIPVFVDHKHAIAHNKIIIIDEKILITGSFNFSRGANERNAENLLVIRNADIAMTYKKNWDKCREHSIRM